MFDFDFKTACAPVFVPIDSNNDINLSEIPKYYSYLTQNGIKSFFVNGGSGEFSNLTMKERRQVLEKWMEVRRDDSQIAVNVGTANLIDTIDLGNHALQFNVDALVILPPYYMPIGNETDLLDYLTTICKSLSRQIPILYYHIPMLTKTNIDLELLLSLAHEHKFDNLSAIKFTHSSESDLCKLMHKVDALDNKVKVYCGFEPLLQEAIDAGVRGCVLAFVNIIPARINAIFNGGTSESPEVIMSDVRNIFFEISDFATEHRVQIMALLKMAAQLCSGIALGPMRKPYALSANHSALFKNLLVRLNLITER